LRQIVRIILPAAGVLAGDPFDRVTEIVQKMPAVGDLSRRWCAAGRPVSVAAAPIAADHLGCGARLEPIGELVCRAAIQEIDGAVGFSIYEYGAVHASSPQGELIDPQHARVRQHRLR
jgi:hypothetical protein